MGIEIIDTKFIYVTVNKEYVRAFIKIVYVGICTYLKKRGLFRETWIKTHRRKKSEF